MYTCYRYWFIEPLQEAYEDTGGPPLVAFDVHGTKRRYEVAILGDASSGIPRMLRLATFGLGSEEIPEGAHHTLQTLKEHALSVLRLMDDAQTSFFPISTWIFVGEGCPPAFRIQPKLFQSGHTFDSVSFRNHFNGSFPIRSMLKLLTDARLMSLPLNYKYLSLYRILELAYKSRGVWVSQFDALLGQYELKYGQLSLSPKSLSNFIETTRNRCAHGMFKNSKTDEPGLTSLDNEALVAIEQFLPLMNELAVEAINHMSRPSEFRLCVVQKLQDPLGPV